jgi:hypothetical protein
MNYYIDEHGSIIETNENRFDLIDKGIQVYGTIGCLVRSGYDVSELYAQEKYKFANRCGYTDVNPNEIIKKNTAKKFTIRSMNAELSADWKPETIIGGFLGNTINNHDQQYTYSSDENGTVREIRMHKNGQWKDIYGNRYDVSTAPIKFYDYNF